MSWESINRRTTESVFRKGDPATVTLVGGTPEPCRAVIWRDYGATVPSENGFEGQVGLIDRTVAQLRTRIDLAAAAGVAVNSGNLWLKKRNGMLGAAITITPTGGAGPENYIVEDIIKRELDRISVFARLT